MRILIADDDAVSRRLLQSYLEKWGHEVIATVNGAEAWAAYQREQFPVVISDWMMPELDGPELVRRIRAAQQADYVFIILLTARAQKEDVVEGMEAGADDFVTKPFDRDELRVRLRAGQRIVELEKRLTECRRALEATQAELAKNASLLADARSASERNAGLRAALESGSRLLSDLESHPSQQKLHDLLNQLKKLQGLE